MKDRRNNKKNTQNTLSELKRKQNKKKILIIRNKNKDFFFGTLAKFLAFAKRTSERKSDRLKLTKKKNIPLNQVDREKESISDFQKVLIFFEINSMRERNKCGAYMPPTYGRSVVHTIQKKNATSKYDA